MIPPQVLQLFTPELDFFERIAFDWNSTLDLCPTVNTPPSTSADVALLCHLVVLPALKGGVHSGPHHSLISHFLWQWFNCNYQLFFITAVCKLLWWDHMLSLREGKKTISTSFSLPRGVSPSEDSLLESSQSPAAGIQREASFVKKMGWSECCWRFPSIQVEPSR